MRDRDREFAEFVRAHRGDLVATARLLAAGDGHLAEDLVQTALVRVHLAWSRARADNPIAYARRALVNCTTDHHRRSVRASPWSSMTPGSPLTDDQIVELAEAVTVTTDTVVGVG
jgi:DNA-directed RNA polymerase specialized sigma24 family protein